MKRRLSAWRALSARALRVTALASLQRRAIMAAMPQVRFTPQLRRFTETPVVTSSANTLRAALEDAFAVNPRLRGYVLDEQGHVRVNVVIYIGAQRCEDRKNLNQTLAVDAQVHVLQALSGG
jgi:sulfur-carrier protein